MGLGKRRRSYLSAMAVCLVEEENKAESIFEEQKRGIVMMMVKAESRSGCFAETTS